MHEQICLFLKCVNFSEKFVHAKNCAYLQNMYTFLVNIRNNIKKLRVSNQGRIHRYIRIIQKYVYSNTHRPDADSNTYIHINTYNF